MTATTGPGRPVRGRARALCGAGLVLVALMVALAHEPRPGPRREPFVTWVDAGQVAAVTAYWGLAADPHAAGRYW